MKAQPPRTKSAGVCVLGHLPYNDSLSEYIFLIMIRVMIHQTIQDYKNQYVVRSRTNTLSADATHLLKKLAQLRNAASRKWQGSPDAVAEIRNQRGAL